MNIALIGTGTIAHTHAEAVESLPNATLLGCYSRSYEKAKQFAAQHNCTAYGSLDNMLSNPKLDIVIVCTPSGNHLELGLKAMQYNKHVIIEKPLEITLERVDKLIDYSQEKNLKLTCIFQSRFTNAARELKKAVEQNRFGKITMADAIVKWYRTQEYYDSGKWRGTMELDGGGALMNQSIHAIDLLLWVMGDVEQIQAITATLGHERIEVEDTAAAVLKFKNGAIGTIQGTTAAYPGFRKRIEINGTHGSVVMEDDFFTKWTFKNETEDDKRIRKEYGEPSTPGETASDPTVNPTELFALQIADFIEAIENNRVPFVTPRSARKSVDVILGIYKSAGSSNPYFFTAK
jgi:predicted dehydrogenase